MIQELYKLEVRIYYINPDLAIYHDFTTFDTFPTEKECLEFKESFVRDPDSSSIELTITKFWQVKL